MKKLLLLTIIALIFLSFNVKSQQFAPLGAKWYYSHTPWSYPLRIEPVIVEAAKDTIILNKNCRKLNAQGNKYLFSEGNKVFLYNEFSNIFIKIYDFDLLAGDTLRFQYGWDSSFSHYVIDSIGYTTINSKLRKIQYISTPFTFENTWIFYGYNIEGIGNSKYLFPQFALADPIISVGLRCYEDSVIGYYNTGLLSVCDSVILLGVNETDPETIKIYPNPASEFIQIDNIVGLITADIYSIDGKLQKTADLSDKTTIKINDLAKGIYLLRLQNEKGVIYRKFIKQ